MNLNSLAIGSFLLVSGVFIVKGHHIPPPPIYGLPRYGAGPPRYGTGPPFGPVLHLPKTYYYHLHPKFPSHPLKDIEDAFYYLVNPHDYSLKPGPSHGHGVIPSPPISRPPGYSSKIVRAVNSHQHLGPDVEEFSIPPLHGSSPVVGKSPGGIIPPIHNHFHHYYHHHHHHHHPPPPPLPPIVPAPPQIQEHHIHHEEEHHHHISGGAPVSGQVPVPDSPRKQTEVFIPASPSSPRPPQLQLSHFSGNGHQIQHQNQNQNQNQNHFQNSGQYGGDTRHFVYGQPRIAPNHFQGQHPINYDLPTVQAAVPVLRATQVIQGGPHQRGKQSSVIYSNPSTLFRHHDGHAVIRQAEAEVPPSKQQQQQHHTEKEQHQNDKRDSSSSGGKIIHNNSIKDIIDDNSNDNNNNNNNINNNNNNNINNNNNNININGNNNFGSNNDNNNNSQSNNNGNNNGSSNGNGYGSDSSNNNNNSSTNAQIVRRDRGRSRYNSRYYGQGNRRFGGAPIPPVQAQQVQNPNESEESLNSGYPEQDHDQEREQEIQHPQREQEQQQQQNERLNDPEENQKLRQAPRDNHNNNNNNHHHYRQSNYRDNHFQRPYRSRQFHKQIRPTHFPGPLPVTIRDEPRAAQLSQKRKKGHVDCSHHHDSDEYDDEEDDLYDEKSNLFSAEF